jgi:hypothetical protein
MKATKWKFKSLERLTDWLGGVGLRERVDALEKGTLYECIKCSRVFYDKESLEERRSCKRRPGGHNCFDVGRYVILKRGFSRILWAVMLAPGETHENAVLRFFKNYK